MELGPEDYVLKRAMQWDEAESAETRIKKAPPSPEKEEALEKAKDALYIAKIKLRASVEHLRRANEKKRKGES